MSFLKENIEQGFWKAVSQGNDGAVRMFLERIPEIRPNINNLHPHNNWSSLFVAVYEGHTKVVKTLLDWGAHIDQPCAFNETPLQLAASMGHVEIMKLFLQKKDTINLNGCNHRGRTALHEAVLKDTGITELLIEAGADLNVKENSWGQTPLHQAVSFNNINAVKALLQAGADKTVRDNKNRTPLDMIEDFFKEEDKETLRQLFNEYPKKENEGVHTKKVISKQQNKPSFWRQLVRSFSYTKN